MMNTKHGACINITTETRHFLLSFLKLICQTACGSKENTALNDCLCVTRFHVFFVLYAQAVKLTNDSLLCPCPT